MFEGHQSGRVVALCGCPRSGKDTIAKSLPAHNFRLVSFAEPIRNCVDSLKLQNKDDKNEKGPLGVEYRESMTVLATKLRSKLKKWLPSLTIDPDNLFVEIAAIKVRTWLDLGYSVCITDLRFKYELDWIRSNGGLVVHIIRDSSESEKEVVCENVSRMIKYDEEADITVINNGSVSDAVFDLTHKLSLLSK